MAKQITALKCPQCGSVKKQSIKDDHYICNHCDTEYFLNSDDINVNVTHHTIGGTPSYTNPSKNRFQILMIALGAIILMFLMALPLFTSNSKATLPEETYSDWPMHEILYDDAEGNSGVFFVMERRYNGFSKKDDEYLAVFYDPVNNKIINEQLLDNQWSSRPSINYRKFSDGNLYVIPNGINRLYRLDPQSHKLIDHTIKMLEGKAEFSSGVATIALVNDEQGDGFKIMTNNGKEYYYYPVAEKIYADSQQLRKDAEELSTLPADAKEKKYYIFTKKGYDYPNEPIQLVQYLYKEKPGYPRELPYGAEWKDFTDYSTPKYATYKALFSRYDERIGKHRDLTPGRMYFKPEVIYQEGDRLFIKTMPNANPENPELIQKIDVNTGNVLWTYKPQGQKAEIGKVVVTKSAVGFHLFSFGSPRTNKYIILKEQDGSLIKEFDLDQIKLK